MTQQTAWRQGLVVERESDARPTISLMRVAVISQGPSPGLYAHVCIHELCVHVCSYNIHTVHVTYSIHVRTYAKTCLKSRALMSSFTASTYVHVHITCVHVRILCAHEGCDMVRYVSRHATRTTIPSVLVNPCLYYCCSAHQALAAIHCLCIEGCVTCTCRSTCSALNVLQFIATLHSLNASKCTRMKVCTCTPTCVSGTTMYTVEDKKKLPFSNLNFTLRLA